MYPTLNPEPVDLYINDTMIRIPRKMIAASYAGAWSAKECSINNGIPLLRHFKTSFKDKYRELMPECIVAANNIGLSATIEILEYWNPGKQANEFLKERAKHTDNPWYPFFEED